MVIPLIVALLACGGDSEQAAPARSTGPGGFPVLEGETQATNLALYQLEARWELGAPTLPPSTEPPDEFVLEHEEIPNPKNVHRKLTVLRAPLPFPVSAEEQRFAPVGLKVFVEGQEVPFSRGKAAAAAEPSWRVTGAHLVLSWPGMPKPGSVRIHYPGVQSKLDRHDPAKAGLSPADFVRYDLTIDQHTRHGLMLPAPTKGTWTVTLPKEAPRFETWLAMEPSPLEKPKSDGAMAVLSVVADGKTTEVAKQKVAPKQDAFQRWQVDLAAWAGEQVELVLETRPLKNNHFDWVFMGSPSVWGQPGGEVRRVVVLAMDTTRPDHFGFYGYPRGTTPNMDRIAKESVTFDRTWSVAPRTRPSFRSATTGRLPLKAVGATNIAEVFQRNGFATAGFVANVHLQPRFDFDHGFESWWYDGKANAVDQVDRALGWLKANEARDTYLFLHFMDPHLPYKAPDGFETRFVEDPDPTLPQHFNRWEVTKWSNRGKISDKRKAHIEGLHDGEMAYMDMHLGRFFDRLDELPGKTLVVVHSDHGEEFWEHDGYEHNHTLYDEVTRAVLWFRPGGGLPEGRHLDAPASLMDIGPTLYDMLGLTDAPETDGHSLRPFLEGRQVDWPERPVPVAYLQYDRERWGVVFRDHKYILHTGSGAEELYDLKADPEEKKNLAASTDLQPWREALGAAHDVPVRPGYRVRVDLKQAGGEPVRVELPAPAVAADVLDPETYDPHRANQEWGEPPRKRPDQVGTVALSPDKTSLVFTPGPDPEGIVWVQLETPAPADGVKVSLGDELLPLEARGAGRGWGRGGRSIVVDPGTILVPPPGEAERMAALRGAEDADDDTIQLLKDLGYIH